MFNSLPVAMFPVVALLNQPSVQTTLLNIDPTRFASYDLTHHWLSP